MNKTKVLTGIYDRLFKSFGKQYWWPGDSKFEVIIGAILTQNTNWRELCVLTRLWTKWIGQDATHTEQKER